jgi:multiple sugar transport system permease protein
MHNFNGKNKRRRERNLGRKHSASREHYSSASARKAVRKSITLVVLLIGVIVIITPFFYMIGTSFKDPEQLKMMPPPILPYKYATTTINGQIRSIYEVEIDGHKEDMVLIKKAPDGMGYFANEETPEEQILLKIDDQHRIRRLVFNWENYRIALTTQPFGRYLINTTTITFVSMVGIVISSSLVAYGFAMFRAKWLDVLFVVLLSTIMLPRQVTLIPLYVFFTKIGWVDTLFPLIVPAFFTSAYDVFLFRQFFLTIPSEMEDAAKIDGANRLQSYLHIILPQSFPVIFSVCILHFMYTWNDFYEPLIYLHSQKNWTIAVGLQTFNAIYTENTHLIMAASVVLVLPPILLFFLSQRYFQQGIVISGVKG